jgi:hypothetical protein
MKDYKPHQSKYKKCALHRLLALAFIENIENKPFVNHIDGNKLNNTLDNLEWVTSSENNLHAHKVGLTKGDKKKNCSI